MTPEQKAKLFGQMFGLLDSDQPGERETALGKIHGLRAKMGWPTFVDVLHLVGNSVSPQRLEATEQERDQWRQAHDQRVTENATLARRNAALAARIAGLRTALWVMVNWRMMAGFAVVAMLGSATWWWWSQAQAAPDQSPVAKSDDTAQTAIDAALGDILSRTRWGGGDTAPTIVTLNGTPYWVVVRGSIDAQSHADAQGRLIERHCLKLYAREAIRDAGAFVAPAPYLAFGMGMMWRQRAAECRMPGTRNYQ